MRAYHITLRSSLTGIRRYGLQPMEARTRQKVVWLCTVNRLKHLVQHIAQHKGCAVADLCVLTLDLAKDSVVRQRYCIYQSYYPISAKRITNIRAAIDLLTTEDVS